MESEREIFERSRLHRPKWLKPSAQAFTLIPTVQMAAPEKESSGKSGDREDSIYLRSEVRDIQLALLQVGQHWPHYVFTKSPERMHLYKELGLNYARIKDIYYEGVEQRARGINRRYYDLFVLIEFPAAEFPAAELPQTGPPAP